MRYLRHAAITAVVTAAVSIAAAGISVADDQALPRASKSYLWHNGPVDFVDTSKFKKDPPYVIGFSNASISSGVGGSPRRS